MNNYINNSHIDSYRIQKLEEFQDTKNLKFNDIMLLNTAFSHSSYVNEAVEDIESNEKLEFLGDSVLTLIVNEYLYKSYPHYSEGQLSKLKSVVVSESSLAYIARIMNLGDYLLLGKGEKQYGGAKRDAILADTMEAVLGAYYLDDGLDKVSGFILPYIKEELEKIDKDEYRKDYKSALQLITQQKYKSCPEYKTIKEEGPDHDKIFYVNVTIEGKELCTGKGSNKKSAQQEAAKKALKIIEQQNIFSD